jgi:ribonuclease R
MAKKSSSNKQRRDKRDPHAKREAARYEQPIASREHILGVIDDADHPVGREELAGMLKISTDDGHEALRRRLNAMTRDGQLVRNRRNCYALADRLDLVAGRVIGHPDGFGFLVTDDEGADALAVSR